MRREEDGRDRDREHPLREHVDQERLLDRGRREVRVDAAARRRTTSISALMLISPRPSVTGSISLNVLLDRRVAPVDHDAEAFLAAVEAAQPRHRQEHLDERGDQDRDGVDVELACRSLFARGTPSTSPAMIARFQNDRRERRDGEVVVGVEDPDDDPGDAEQDHDREEHAREPDGEGLVPARVRRRCGRPTARSG